ncbi:MAG TPA: WecB/TagA/CpsF family glycosyltransferase [Myxococcaceae bacterium]|nr:WecB/TagA/CpsF family glycosyltransferase [Myxococcaceae bacterium]
MSARFRVGRVWADVVDLEGAIERIEALVSAGAGGAVFTPNVDHVVNAERMPALADAYARADLCTADGMPLVWASRLLGPVLPERVAGSDLAGPLLARASARSWPVFLLGGRAGAAEKAAEAVRQGGVKLVGAEGPVVGLDGSVDAAVLDRVRSAKPALLLVGLGSPKQELFIDRHRATLGSAVCFACGAVIDFLAGELPRAPRWMARTGLEWAYRLGREPRRLWRRYLVNDPAFLRILARDWNARRFN